MTLDLAVVDAFTDRPFSGNPAAVAILDAFPDDLHMQAIARELNLSETAFVVQRADGDHDLRWFTPRVEVDLCGHATLAAAHVLGGSTSFHTRSGLLTCTRASGGWIEMDFPSDPPIEAPLLPALGLAGVRWCGFGRWNALIELQDAAMVRGFQPDLAKIAAVDTHAVIITAAGDRTGIDCVSRVFGPNVGIPEDPVTGSAHCTLAVFWGQRLGLNSLTGEQASDRGGIVRMQRNGDRVTIAGQAVSTANVQLIA